jgi:hypothetical protein
MEKELRNQIYEQKPIQGVTYSLIPGTKTVAELMTMQVTLDRVKYIVNFISIMDDPLYAMTIMIDDGQKQIYSQDGAIDQNSTCILDGKVERGWIDENGNMPGGMKEFNRYWVGEETSLTAEVQKSHNISVEKLLKLLKQ